MPFYTPKVPAGAEKFSSTAQYMIVNYRNIISEQNPEFDPNQPYNKTDAPNAIIWRGFAARSEQLEDLLRKGSVTEQNLEVQIEKVKRSKQPAVQTLCKETSVKGTALIEDHRKIKEEQVVPLAKKNDENCKVVLDILAKTSKNDPDSPEVKEGIKKAKNITNQSNVELQNVTKAINTVVTEMVTIEKKLTENIQANSADSLLTMQLSQKPE